MNNTRTTPFYIANIGSELSRVLTFLKKEEDGLVRNALVRIEKIIDTILQEEKSAAALAEILILKEAMTGFRNKERILEVDIVELQNYCMPFIMKVMHV